MPDFTGLAESGAGCSAAGLTPHELIHCLVSKSTELLVECCFGEEIVYYLWHVFLREISIQA